MNRIAILLLLGIFAILGVTAVRAVDVEGAEECLADDGTCESDDATASVPKSSKAKSVCEDKEESCAGWAEMGECDENPEYMRGECDSCPFV